jgi:2-keto-4-pentenoate hydratase
MLPAGADLAALALRQLEDYDRREPGTVFADESFALTVGQAYALQIRVAALRQRRGETVAGYKIGCVSEAVHRQLGLAHPVFGHIFSGELHPAGAVLDGSRYAGLAVEGELAVRLGSAPPQIAAVFPVIELHHYTLRSANQAAQELIANNAIHAGAVMPAEEPAGDLEGIRNEPLTVWINGQPRGTSPGRQRAKEIFSRLRALEEHLRSFGIRLEPGQIVLTGSPLPLYRVQAGDCIEVWCGCLPVVGAKVV